MAPNVVFTIISTGSVKSSGRLPLPPSVSTTHSMRRPAGGLRVNGFLCSRHPATRHRFSASIAANDYDFDFLICVLYDQRYNVVEVRQWDAEKYRATFDTVTRLSPTLMRHGTFIYSNGPR